MGTGTSPCLAVVIVGATTRGWRTSPCANRAVSANGWKIDCRHAGPPGSHLIEPMVLTSWAWQAAVTRSLCLSSVMSREPTTTASSTV